MQEIRLAIDERISNPPPFPTDRFADKGIVICAGGLRYFTCAWVLISILRRVLKTKLPIQVWHIGRKELSEAMQLLLEEEGVEVVNAETVLHRYPATIAGGWPLKPYAITQSRFREVIFLDADTVPLIDPAELFEWDRYRSSGLLLWPDVIDLRRRNPIWTSLALEPRNCMSVDSGVIAIDKARSWRLLDIALLLNEHWRQSYTYLHGDKDTFLIAALLTGVSQPVIEHRPLTADGDLIQRNLDGDPFLHHRTASKWKLFGPNQPVIVPELTRHCEESLAELRRRWSGAVFHAPNRSERARAVEAELIDRRHFRYASSDGKARRLELLRAGTIGEGRSDLEQHWAVIEREGHLLVQFFSGSRLVVELLRQPDGSWRGASLGSPGFDALLATEQDWQTWPHVGDKRVERLAAAELIALLDPSLFAAGFDRQIEQELHGALFLLNRLHDDVPEQLTARLAVMNLSQVWRVALEALVDPLTKARDARLSLTPDDLVAPLIINPQHYSRIF